MTRPATPIQVESLAEFRDYLVKRRVTMIVIHEANYASPKLLADYFNYDEREGLKQVRALDGWRLVYSYPGKPTKFLRRTRSSSSHRKVSGICEDARREC